MRKSDLERAIVAMLIKALTPAQRAALLWLPADGSERAIERNPRLEISLHCLRERRVLEGVSADLATFTYDRKWDEPNRWKATPLGLTVRAQVVAADGERGAAPVRRSAFHQVGNTNQHQVAP